MAVQRLEIDSFTDETYELIAIHSSIPPFRLAFLLNKNLNLKLFRSDLDIQFEYEDLIANFHLYTYEDNFQYRSYSLIENKFQIQIETDNKDDKELFTNRKETYVKKYLVPELNKVDYFLKIETEMTNFSSKPILSQILDITQIITAYNVDHETLKSKHNLIFE